MSPTVRDATPDDAPALAELYDRVWALETSALGEKLAAERRAAPEEIRRWIETDRYLVVEETGRVAAVMGIEARHGTYHLAHLAVLPEYRRRGLARSLMERAEALARESGAVKIWFDTAPGLEAARRLYASLGYAPCGYLRRHYWGTDLIVYEKLL
ncbi:MAG: GNAT family N-acetyltransferase [Candidatus Zixiibacteriota bacterium]|nr:MAG: GNAT family N-acetyltransferase [candidate division Zixibacteria bacterium]